MLRSAAVACRLQSTWRRGMYASLSSPGIWNFTAENTVKQCRHEWDLGVVFSGESLLRCQQRKPTLRRLGTAHCLLKKEGGKDDGERTHKFLSPGDVPVGHESIERTQGRKTMIVSPPTVQVFADPTMSKTVRDISVDIEKIKGQLKFMREEFSDSSFEVLKLVQGRSSIIAALKETRKFCRDNQSAIMSLKTEQNKLDELITYISKMIARHENQLNDSKKGQEKDAFSKKIDNISHRLDQANKSIHTLTTVVHEKLQNDVKKALTDTEQLRTEVTRLQLELRYRGREITELKSKSPTDFSN
ncbi:uncharacterized protein LOC110985117 [Acanthaster planci]|uniref:Uncharacterized protein LOC110985117 n=1 Tax=Acanthaster planci TaxID=133434 RepID=A0A8B7Z7J5_ACAPL|nr:uncharacterized protein LOC110985117 [Acanthaster planci]